MSFRGRTVAAPRGGLEGSGSTCNVRPGFYKGEGALADVEEAGTRKQDNIARQTFTSVKGCSAVNKHWIIVCSSLVCSPRISDSGHMYEDTPWDIIHCTSMEQLTVLGLEAKGHGNLLFNVVTFDVNDNVPPKGRRALSVTRCLLM